MVPAGRLTLATPTPAVALAFATASGYGPGNLTATVHFADGTPDVQAAFGSPDWFGQGQAVVSTHNRVYVANGTYDYFDPTNPLRNPGPVLWEQVVPLAGLAAAHPVSAVDLSWLPADPQRPTHTSIFGLSTAATLAGPFTAAPLTDDSFNQDVVVEASAVPEPAAAFFMLAATLARRSRCRPRPMHRRSP